MSLFENDDYQWRETYFVLFEAKDRPRAEVVADELRTLRGHYEISDTRANEEGLIESLTLISDADYAAMDITYVTGPEVFEQVDELRGNLDTSLLTAEEKKDAKRLAACDARLDVYHFEKLVWAGEGAEEEEFLDPGALLIVLDQLAELCHGIKIDPQTGALL